MSLNNNLKTKFLETCMGKIFNTPPVWMMRQAGRYLPEYKAARKKDKNFLNLCFDPSFVVDVTLQPIKRFDFDAAIIFSDILTIPHAMGQSVTFEPGDGPRLIPFDEKFLRVGNFNILDSVYESISKTRELLDVSKSLIGFSGTPWTLAAYMIACEKIGDGRVLMQEVTKFKHLDELILNLVKIVSQHLINQIKAGCDVVQIFDSWAGLCPLDENTYLIKPLIAICESVWGEFPDTPIIYYGRHVSHLYGRLSGLNGPLVLGVDQGADLSRVLTCGRPTQGNLDPEVLIEGGRPLEKAIQDILRVTENHPHIFNLGHGIKPETPLDNVQKMVDLIRKR